MRRTAPFLILAAAILPYLNSLHGGFVSDAGPMFLGGAPLASSHEWLAWLGRDFYWGTPFQDVTLYRPLTVLSFLVHLRTTGLDPFPFLLGNVALHAAVSLLVLLLGRRLVGDTAAFVGSLLFAVHPIHTEAVSWIMGRAELLAACLALAACAAFLRATEPDERRPWLFASGAICIYFAALCSKEHVVLLPAWFGLAAMVDRRRAGPRAWTIVAGSVLAAGAFGALRAAALTRAPEMILDRGLFNPAALLDWPHRWLTALGVIARYALLMVWPARLSHDYSFAQVPASASVGLPEALGIAVAAVVLAVVALGLLDRGRADAKWAPPALALSLAALTFLPVSNLPFAIGTIMAERVVYLPSAGIALFVGWLVARWVPLEARFRGTRRFVPIVLLAAIVAALGWRTVARNPVWKDDYALYGAALQASPGSAQVHAILAEQELARGNVPRAAELARQALRIFPEFYSGHVALAKSLVAGGHLESAAHEIRAALPLAPSDDRIRAQLHNNLAVILHQSGRSLEAENECREAIRLAPDDLAPRIALIEWMRTGSRPVEAARELRDAMQVRPAKPALLVPLASAALVLGDAQAAAAIVRRAAEAGVPVPPELSRAAAGAH